MGISFLLIAGKKGHKTTPGNTRLLIVFVKKFPFYHHYYYWVSYYGYKRAANQECYSYKPFYIILTKKSRCIIPEVICAFRHWN